MSGQFSPLHAPFPLRDLPLRAPLRSAPSFFSHARSPLRSAPPDFRVAPLRFPLRSRSAHMLWHRHDAAGTVTVAEHDREGMTECYFIVDIVL